MKRSWSATLSCVGILTVAVGLGVASAQGAAQPAGDQDFVSRAALLNMAAIQIGHMATKQAQRTDVKEFLTRFAPPRSSRATAFRLCSTSRTAASALWRGCCSSYYGCQIDLARGVVCGPEEPSGR